MMQTSRYAGVVLTRCEGGSDVYPLLIASLKQIERTDQIAVHTTRGVLWALDGPLLGFGEHGLSKTLQGRAEYIIATNET